MAPRDSGRVSQPSPKPDPVITLTFIVGSEQLKPHPYPAKKTLGEASEDALKRANASTVLSGYELIRESTGATLSYPTKVGDPTLGLKDGDVLRLRRPKGANA